MADNKSRPWICDRLRIEVGEPFEVEGDGDGPYCIDAQGYVWLVRRNDNDQQIHMEGLARRLREAEAKT